MFQLFFYYGDNQLNCGKKPNFLFCKKGKNLNSANKLALIGMNIAMGMLRLPQVKDYWSTNQISTPWFPGVMARDRFATILRYLHLTDFTTQQKKGERGYDPLFKVRFSIDHLSAVYPQYYYPSRSTK